MNVNAAKSVLRDLSLLDLKLDYSPWWEKILKWRNSYPKPIEIPQDCTDGISSYKLISLVSKTFDGRNVVTGSSGTCIEMLLQSWEVNGNQRIINSCGLGSMGFAIPAAIGISAKTERGEVICIESDGSFAMNLQDLITMKNFGARFKVIIMDSSGYKSISLSQGRLNQFAHGNNHETGLDLPVIEEIALAIGYETRVVEKNEDIQASLEWLSNQSVPSLLVAKVSPSEDALPRLISKPNGQGIMETPPMNVLTPLM
jgi:acetolactate synthase-1/2/3 large subunit